MMNSELLKKDDYWAIWIGGFLLIGGFLIFFLKAPQDFKKTIKDNSAILQAERKKPVKTISWYEASDNLKNLKGQSTIVGKFFKNLTTKPSTWKANPLDAFWLQHTPKEKDPLSSASISELEKEIQRYQLLALDAQEIAGDRNYQDAELNADVEIAVGNWLNKKDELSKLSNKMSPKSYNKIPWLVGLLVTFGILFGIGSYFMGTSFNSFFKGFSFVFIIGLIAYFLAAQADVKAIGFGYAAWAIIIGLLISNTIGTPEWVKPGVQTELYIKTGLVILGAEILLSKILAIGLPGIFVAWIVTPVVLVSTYWFGQRVLKIGSKTLNMTISADMSVCGVSAAVATAAACKASKEELTVAIGLSMMFTSAMMILMPAFINYMGMPEVLGGAWIGGTIDATGAVVAAGAFLGEKALSVAATIKMIQNVLIGVIAFGVAVYFTTKVEKNADNKIGKNEIWKRFPKFILGFIGASLLFSIIYVGLGEHGAYTIIDQGVIAAFTKNIRGWLFCLAFVSIGLSINFSELKKHFVGGKPLVLYLVGQTLNLCLTLLMAYIMFYLVFPNITANI